MFYGSNAQTFKYAKKLRGNMTVGEKILWNHLSNKQLQGYRFKRQHPIRNYIADFYCHKVNLVIEVDGKIHETEKQMIHDKDRTAAIEELGCRVLRFTNDDVFNVLGEVITSIKNELTHSLKPPAGRRASPLEEVGGASTLEKKNDTI